MVRPDPPSELAREILALPARVRQQLGVPDGVVLVWDVALSAVRLVLDDEDERPVLTRLEGLLNAQSVDPMDPRLEEIRVALIRVGETKEVPDWVTRLTREEFRAYVERAAGTAAYHRLRRALVRDLAVAIVVVRRVVQFLQPYAVAIEDMLLLMDAPQRKRIVEALGPAGALIVSVAIQADQIVGKALDAALADHLSTEIFTNLPKPTPEEIASIVPQLRAVIADRSRALAEELGSVVARKMKGAHDAVALSADPVSQAANSLIELIDRLLRSSFSDVEVLQWIDDNYPDEERLTYLKDGNRKPTKLGQARCFVFAGEPRGEQPAVGEFLATVLVNARNALQKLKHADTGSPSELEELARLMGAVEGFFALGIRLAWSQLSDESVAKLHRRIDPTREASAHGVDRSDPGVERT